jgi:hypothetical protein
LKLLFVSKSLSFPYFYFFLSYPLTFTSGPTHPNRIKSLNVYENDVLSCCGDSILMWRRGTKLLRSVKHVKVNRLFVFGPLLVSMSDDDATMKIWQLPHLKELSQIFLDPRHPNYAQQLSATISSSSITQFHSTSIVHPQTYLNKVSAR